MKEPVANGAIIAMPLAARPVGHATIPTRRPILHRQWRCCVWRSRVQAERGTGAELRPGRWWFGMLVPGESAETDRAERAFSFNRADLRRSRTCEGHYFPPLNNCGQAATQPCRTRRRDGLAENRKQSRRTARVHLLDPTVGDTAVQTPRPKRGACPTARHSRIG
jgi:hypothetical protein